MTGAGPVAPAAPPAAAVRAPVTERDRIVSLDVLRGVAVLGILLLNIQSFAMISSAYTNPTAYGSLEGIDGWVWRLTHLLGDQKFMTIFSILFGAGIVLMSERAEATGRGSAAVHYRRMGWLILFGLLHAHLLWFGDVLYLYGLCGLGVYLLRRAHPAVLLGLGVILIAVASGISLFFGWSVRFWPDAQVAAQTAQWTPGPEAVARELAVYRGGWLEQMRHRVPTAFFFQTFLAAIWGVWRAGGLMLVGMAIYRLGVLSAARSRRFYVVMGTVGLAVGLGLTGYGMHWNASRGWAFPDTMFFGTQFNYWGSLGGAAAWIALIVGLCRADAVRRIARPLAAVGRMALTNYLLETVICTLIFYGHGLGQFGRFSRLEQLLTVLGVWAVLLVVSPLWLRAFRFGPAEWLWRSLTYARLQPIRRS
ncbi:MAG: DUF418 domain-containing protein [Planctomycetota bacterium]